MVLNMNRALSQIAFIASFTAALTGGAFIGIADLWAFPVPYDLVLIVPIYITILVIVFVAVVGLDQFQKTQNLGRQLAEQIQILVVQASLWSIQPSAPFTMRFLPENKDSLP